MWYFTWILGVLLACSFGIINVLWLEAQESLDQDSEVLDPLTKLPTRVEFLESLEEKIDQYKNDQTTFSLLMVALGSANTSLQDAELQTSDQAVLKVSDMIQRETRRPIDVVARYDAETFAIILPSADTHSAQPIAQRICESAAQQSELQSYGTLVSVGVAEYPGDASCGTDDSIQDKIRAILQTTDKALKNAQQQGVNQSCCAVSEMI